MIQTLSAGSRIETHEFSFRSKYQVQFYEKKMKSEDTEGFSRLHYLEHRQTHKKKIHEKDDREDFLLHYKMCK